LIDSARIIGLGRAGRSLGFALERAGWTVDQIPRDAPVADAADGCQLLVIATPDPAIARVAAAVVPNPDAVVVHLAGSLGLDVLGHHPRRASLHPLVALPEPVAGSERLVGAWFAVSGDPLVHDVIEALGGRRVEVADEHRVAYHAAAVVASNHLVALLGQAERIAAVAGVPFEALIDLVRSNVENVADLGPAGALTGPVARGDFATVARHLDALEPAERTAYDVMSNEARKLALSKPAEVSS